ncbi:MAG: DNA-binding protein WhiA [Clostridia bacterium]|nr:DNA-binding protein WhiA [Clostridia bacterium]
MSFADSLRAELCEIAVKKPCCRRAFGAGLLLCSKRDSGHCVLLRCREERVAALASDMLEKGYAKAPTVTVSGSHGHRYWDLELSSPAAAKLVGQMQAESCDIERLLKMSACEGCRSAFLRGAFLNWGTVSDPQKSSHLEFLLPDGLGERALSSLLEANGYPPKRMMRKGTVGLYYKDAMSLGDLFTMMGSHHIIFEFYNTRIERDIRNNENRATNCVARNIEKSIAAAARQMEAIGTLMESGKFESLPEPLRVTALLRYRNPEATLDELKELHVPPISKSGLNHRLQKLMEAAEN